MENIMKRFVYTTPSAAHIKVHWAVRAEFLVLIMFSSVVGICLLISRRPMPHSFLVVNDLFGASRRQLEVERGFTCHDINQKSQPNYFWCIQYTKQQPFSSIYIQVNDTIGQEVDISFRKNSVRLGDLILLWGEPQTRALCELSIISWSMDDMEAMSLIPRSKFTNYFAPIPFVNFIRRGMPDWGQEAMNDARSGCQYKHI